MCGKNCRSINCLSTFINYSPNFILFLIENLNALKITKAI